MSSSISKPCTSPLPSRSRSASSSLPRAAEHIGRQGLAQRVRLQQHREPGHRALFHRRTGKTAERRPDGSLLVRADGHAAAAGLPPIRPPRCGSPAVDAGERLEGDTAVRAQVVMLAAQPGWWRASSAPCRRRRCASRHSDGTARPASPAARICPCRSALRSACAPRRRCASPAGTAWRHRCA